MREIIFFILRLGIVAILTLVAIGYAFIRLSDTINQVP